MYDKKIDKIHYTLWIKKLRELIGDLIVRLRITILIYYTTSSSSEIEYLEPKTVSLNIERTLKELVNPDIGYQLLCIQTPISFMKWLEKILISILWNFMLYAQP